EALLKAGTSKEAPIAPGKAGQSKLYQLLVTDDEDDRMPQKNEALPKEEISKIKEWIEQGARFDGPAKNAALVAIIPPIQQPDPPSVYPSPISVTALAFSEDGSELAASGYHEITVWESATGQLKR